MAFAAQVGGAARRAGADFGEPVRPQGLRPIPGPPDLPVPPAANDADACPEIACLRGRIPAEVLAAARDRAAAVGVGADRVLIASGAISEEDYLRALGERLGIDFEPLDGQPRRQCPLDDARLIESADKGMLPLSDKDDTVLALAPRGTAARHILHLIAANPALARRFRFTCNDRINRFVLHHAGETLAQRASESLRRQWPALSAAAPRRRGLLTAAVLAIALLAGALMLTPAAARQGLGVLLAGLFLAWLGLRLVGACIRPPAPAATAALPARELPVYSVIAALYREAAAVGGLLAALERLDYPIEKLDVIVALEADDRETRAAIDAYTGRLPVTVVTVPAAGPRTKPKALNVALPFARGTFTVVYDAEDRPERDQLRQALQAFHRGGESSPACRRRSASTTPPTVGSRACSPPNMPANSISSYPASRGSRCRCRSAARPIISAPTRCAASARGILTTSPRMPTSACASRVSAIAPRPSHRPPTKKRRRGSGPGCASARAGSKAGRRPGWCICARRSGFGANWVGAASSPSSSSSAAMCWRRWCIRCSSPASSTPRWRGGWPGGGGGLAALYGATALAGYLVSGLTGFLGLARRRLRKVAWVLLLMPLHWLLLSLAAWRALYQFAVAPYAWEKTEHGLARHSRRAETLTQALVALEGELRRLKESGELPALARERKVRFNVTGSRPSVRPRESGDPERKAADPRFRGNERTVPI